MRRESSANHCAAKSPLPPPRPPKSPGWASTSFGRCGRSYGWPGSAVAQLSARENDLLLLLAQHRNGVLDRRACLRQLWGNDDFFAARSMDVYVSRLRKRLAQDPSLEILNIRGVGFKLIT
ncbi:winged helix family transcriptional regulator [Hymenobacter sp. UV11]|nr:winged helix family transcriptional regulator [Hymenobacter sp. UV11]